MCEFRCFYRIRFVVTQSHVYSHKVTKNLENAAASYISTRPFNSDIVSRAAFQIVQEWLAECHFDHKLCPESVSGFLPTRVVDLRGTNQSGVIKIVDTRSNRSAERAIYATLSYCWGGDQAVKTTLATLNRHLAGIRVTQLGKT